MPEVTEYKALVDVIYMPNRKRRTQPRKIPKGTTFPASTLTPADIKALLAAKHIAEVTLASPTTPAPEHAAEDVTA